jgi:L-2-hydroxyglutarate oxidase LhgO
MNDILNEVDITIVGAGIVGLAIASEVARQGRKVYVVEKNRRFGEEQSSHSSEVIHAGIYYGTDSLKKDLCIEGNRLLYQICENHGIAYKRCGKIVIATRKSEETKIEELYLQGLENGVRLEMLDKKNLKSLEPNLEGFSAFLSPDTGILDSYNLMKYFLYKALDNGAQAAYQSEATDIETIPGGYKVYVGNKDNNFTFATRVLINSAGLHSDTIAQKAGMDIDKLQYRVSWCKGEYYTVSGGKNKYINRLIYPSPVEVSMDIHVCYDTDWRLRLGPLFYPVNQLDYGIDASSKNTFVDSRIFKALPCIEAEDLTPETSGIMVMLRDNGEEFRDFIIRHEDDNGFPGLINLIGIGTPGLTSSPAIARYVSIMVNRILDS